MATAGTLHDVLAEHLDVSHGHGSPCLQHKTSSVLCTVVSPPPNPRAACPSRSYQIFSYVLHKDLHLAVDRLALPSALPAVRVHCCRLHLSQPRCTLSSLVLAVAFLVKAS